MDQATGVPLLMYHEIAPTSETSSPLAVSPDNFVAQLAYLYDNGWQTLSAAQLSRALIDGDGLPDRCAVLTFDDGFSDFHSRAMPVLDRCGFTATLFVTTGWVQDAGPLASGNRPGHMLSWSQIDDAAQAGIEVGAHSRLHVELDQLPPWLLREELYQSKAMLEDKLGCAVSGLAYPFGYSNTMVRMVARELGHSYGCAVGNVALSNSPDLFSLPRFTIRRSTGMSAFRQLVNGTHLARIFAKDRVLTKGWAIFRRSKAALKGGACVDWPEPPQ